MFPNLWAPDPEKKGPLPSPSRHEPGHPCHLYHSLLIPRRINMAMLARFLARLARIKTRTHIEDALAIKINNCGSYPCGSKTNEVAVFASCFE